MNPVALCILAFLGGSLIGGYVANSLWKREFNTRMLAENRNRDELIANLKSNVAVLEGEVKEWRHRANVALQVAHSSSSKH